jgi:hypothetical protein
LYWLLFFYDYNVCVNKKVTLKYNKNEKDWKFSGNVRQTENLFGE